MENENAVKPQWWKLCVIFALLLLASYFACNAQNGWIPLHSKNVPGNYVQATNSKGEVGWMPAPGTDTVPRTISATATPANKMQWVDNETGKILNSTITWTLGSPSRLAVFDTNKRLTGYDSTGRVIYYKDYGQPAVVVDSAQTIDNLFRVMELTIYQRLITH